MLAYCAGNPGSISGTIETKHGVACNSSTLKVEAGGSDNKVSLSYVGVSG